MRGREAVDGGGAGSAVVGHEDGVGGWRGGSGRGKSVAAVSRIGPAWGFGEALARPG